VILSALFGIGASVAWLDHASAAIAQGTPHVRRAFEYVDLPTEESEEGAASSAGSAPVRGDIVFDGFAMSYRHDTPEILRGLSLEIRAGQKIALVGRTGSGKTSLTQSLLRMVYVRAGDVRIGGESIYARPIDAVREAFAVVPQSPYLFAGTVASNFDPSGTILEDRVRAALREAGLSLEPSHPIDEGGRNLSVGERQLVCLARAVALERPFVLLDEPTSGLDPETDARIHRLLRTALKGNTVITIAHRREGLKDYDRVIELRDGRVVTS
jgi:ABC-type multidrug transport system fused ATPase/permease subunit